MKVNKDVRNIFLHINVKTHLEELAYRLSTFELIGKEVRFWVLNSKRTEELVKALKRGKCNIRLYSTLYLDESSDLGSKELYTRIRELCGLVDEVIISTSMTEGIPANSLIREALIRDKQLVTMLDTPQYQNSDGTYGLFISATDDEDNIVDRRIRSLIDEGKKLIIYTTSEEYDDLVSKNCDYYKIPCVRLNYNGVVSQYAINTGDIVVNDIEGILMLKINEAIIDSCRRSTSALRNEINYLLDLGVPITSINHYGNINKDFVLNKSKEIINWG